MSAPHRSESALPHAPISDAPDSGISQPFQGRSSMSSVTAPLYYSAALLENGREDDWVIDALTSPPDVTMNFRRLQVDTRIVDLRVAQDFQPKFDTAGFEKRLLPTQADPAALLERSPEALDAYRHDTEVLLREMTGADAVTFFDATFRREDGDAPRGEHYQSAHQRVHVDQNPRSARARAAFHAGADAERYRRFQIVNIWRPLLAPVRNYALAFCDYASIDPVAELVPTRLHFPEWLKDRENYSLKYSPAHRWYFWSALQPDEAVIFKCYDSASRTLAVASGEGEREGLLEVSGLCPHTAFFDENGPREGCLRTSVEMRALLFYA